jgi:polysaccharide export outer membrane protein
MHLFFNEFAHGARARLNHFFLTASAESLISEGQILQNSGFSVSLRIDRSRAGALPAFRVFMQSLLLLVLGFGALAMLSGCGTSRGGPIPYTELAPPDAPSHDLLPTDEYKVGPLDTLSVKVFQVADLSGDFDVDLSGSISLPLVGSVKVVDLTAEQVDAKLTKLLGEKYLQNPDVSVALKASSTRVVTVDGAVNTPGTFPATRPISLMQAIALARGTNDTANPHRIAIFRQIQGQRMAAAFDLVSIRRGEAEDPRVYSGDIIVVDGSGVKAIQRQIMNSLPLVSVFTPFALR